MPRFYFHILKDAARVLDRTGLVFPDETAARRAALCEIRELMSQAKLHGFNISTRHIEIEVEAENGDAFVVPFSSAFTAEP